MTFPNVVAGQTALTDSTGSDTTHTVNLPSGLTNGNLLIVIFTTDGLERVMDWPNEGTDFIVIYDEGNSGGHSVNIAYHDIDGSYSTSFDITIDNGEPATAIAIEIENAADPATQAPEASTGVTGNSDSPDPDAASAGGGTIDYMHLAHASGDNGPFTGFPTNCPDNNLVQDTGAASGASCSLASDEDTSATFNPDTFSFTSDNWAAGTITIHPGAGATPGPGTISDYRYRQSVMA